MNHSVNKNIAGLEEIVKEAGRKLMEFWPGAAANAGKELGIETKSDGSSVTQADLASNNIIISGLKNIFPDFAILSEELPVTPEIVSSSAIWIIDPLDGTKSFIDGRDDFSILLGLAVNRKIEAGIMYFPARDIWAYACKGEGALINGKQPRVSDHRVPAAGSVYYRNFTPPDDECLYREWMDSGLAFLSVCTGELDGVIIRMTAHKEWDLAAPAAMILESGGRFTDENGNMPDFGTGEINYRYLVASNGGVHERLLEMIRKAESN